MKHRLKATSNRHTLSHEKQRRKIMKKWMIGLFALTIVAVGMGAFFGGRASVSQTPSAEANLGPGLGQLQRNQAGTLPAQPGGTNGFAGARAGNLVSGTILSVDDAGLTVKMSDGGSKIVFITNSTTLVKTEEATRDDLAVGEPVTVIGTANEDGSVTATRVQLGETLQLRNRQPDSTGG